MLDRSNKESGTVRLTLVEPLVVEDSADVAWSGRAFRLCRNLYRVGAVPGGSSDRVKPLARIAAARPALPDG